MSFVFKRTTVVAGVLVAGAFTTAIALVPALRFAYEVVGLRIVIDTSVSMIAALLALLVYGRVREAAQLDLAILVFALGMVASANFFLSAIPIAVGNSPATHFSSWAPAAGRVMAAAAFFAAAVVPARSLVRRRGLGVAIAAAVLSITALVALAVAVWGDSLPVAVNPALSPLDSGRPLIVGHPLALTIQITMLVTFAAAAVGFVKRLDRTGDDLYGWLATFAGLAALARLQYFLFPSLYSNWIYTGDFLRLASFVVLLGGALREIRAYWSARAAAAVSEERRRMARDFHDGIAQELAYISSLAAQLPPKGDAAAKITSAAQRASLEARLAISALRSSPAESLTEALQRVAQDAAHRFGLSLRLDTATSVAASAAVSEAAQRIVYEAMSNAARHGMASAVEVAIRRDALIRLTIGDNGRGFAVDPTRIGGTGFGIVSMRERAAAVGGTFEISSSTETGTVIEVTFP